jgi:hypothetical protein
VWHASVATHGLIRSERAMEQQALSALRDVGDRRAGEWVETTSGAVHVRRRLDARDLAALPPEHRELVDVRRSTLGDLGRIVAPVVVSWPSLSARSIIRDQALLEIGADAHDEKRAEVHP